MFQSSVAELDVFRILHEDSIEDPRKEVMGKHILRPRFQVQFRCNKSDPNDQCLFPLAIINVDFDQDPHQTASTRSLHDLQQGCCWPSRCEPGQLL